MNQSINQLVMCNMSSLVQQSIDMIRDRMSLQKIPEGSKWTETTAQRHAKNKTQ